MSMCNYCTYRRYLVKGYRKATAKERKKLWDDKKGTKEFTQEFGTGVIIVNQAGEFVSWFMELPSHCCC